MLTIYLSMKRPLSRSSSRYPATSAASAAMCMMMAIVLFCSWLSALPQRVQRIIVVTLIASAIILTIAEKYLECRRLKAERIAREQRRREADERVAQRDAQRERRRGEERVALVRMRERLAKLQRQLA